MLPATVPNASVYAAVSARPRATRGVRKHSLSLAVPSSSPREYNRTFGWNNWAFLAPYVDFVLAGDAGYSRRAQAAGIATMGYLDVNACSGSWPAGPNRYARPDCAKLPAAAFYGEDGAPDRALTANFGKVLQRFGNPASPALQAAAVAAARDEVARGGQSLIMLDDVTTLDENAYRVICYGDGAIGDDGYSCVDAPGNAAAPPWTAQYSLRTWQAGELALASRLPRPVVLNGLVGRSGDARAAAVLDVILATPGSWGGVCDTCFYHSAADQSNRTVVTGAFLDAQLTGAMRVTAAGKYVAVIDDDVVDPVERQRALADIMLFYDPDRTVLGGEECGPKSLVPVCPEQALTFYAPRRPYPRSPAAVTQRGGAYAREFGACYAGGRPLGPCAAVVNPDRDDAHAFPKLAVRYTHTLTITGNSLCACYGEKGAVAPSGPAAPADLPPASGYVVFR